MNASDDPGAGAKTEPEADQEPTLFEWAGGSQALLRMTRIFYRRYVPEDPLLAPLFADMAPDHRERVAAWLGEVFGGPPRTAERLAATTGWSRGTWERRSAKSNVPGGSNCSASPPTTRSSRRPRWRAAFVSYLEWGSRIALENSQPGAHPPPHMPVPRWSWVSDATPAQESRRSPSRQHSRREADLPGPDEPVSFAQHIKPLFRDGDRRSMRFAFDLWSHKEVATHAPAILDRLRAGTMPCDGAWPEDRVAVFERWLDSERLHEPGEEKPCV